MPDLPDRRQREEALAAALLAVFDDATRDATEPRWDVLAAGIRTSAAIREQLAATFRDAAIQVATAQGVELDVVRLEERAWRWADSFLAVLAEQVVEVSRSRWNAARQTASVDVAALLTTLFSAVRAEKIAATELTRSISTGERSAMAWIESQTSGRSKSLWYTAADERVCAVCGPLHGQRDELWREKFPDGPPAHPNCRCYLQWQPL